MPVIESCNQGYMEKLRSARYPNKSAIKITNYRCRVAYSKNPLNRILSKPKSPWNRTLLSVICFPSIFNLIKHTEYQILSLPDSGQHFRPKSLDLMYSDLLKPDDLLSWCVAPKSRPRLMQSFVRNRFRQVMW